MLFAAGRALGRNKTNDEFYVDFRAFLSKPSGVMNGNEFVRKVKKLGRRRGLTVHFVAERGKGSHGTLYLGDRLTIVRNLKDELKKGTLHAMLGQLGLTLADLIER